jgi:hypothetical protein
LRIVQVPENDYERGNVNADGLHYATVLFSKQQIMKSKQPPPSRETTDYADIDFVRTAAQKAQDQVE